MLDIISVGPGEAVLLTDDAKQAIDRADAVWCAARHAVLVPPEKARPLSPLEGAIEQMRLSSDAGQSAAVLVSGDAGLYSLLEMLKRKIGGEYLRVHPWVRESLNLGGLENVRLFVGERLSYPDERTEAYDPDATYDPLCMAYIENDAPESGLPPVGLSDEAFIRGKTPMTKRDVRALVVSALHLKPNGVVWDIGARPHPPERRKISRAQPARRSRPRAGGAVGAARAGRGFPRRDDRRGRSYRGAFARTSTPDSAGRNRRHDGKHAGASAPDAADCGF